MSWGAAKHAGLVAFQQQQRRVAGGTHALRATHIVWERQLASGGFGELWLGIWPGTLMRVVGKFLRESADASARKGFAREVRILIRKLPGFVRILLFDVDGPRPYYVMEYLPNGSLAKWAGRLSREQLQLIGLDVSAHLAAMHSAGIAHGDIKPHNILLGPDRRVRIADPIGCGWGCTVLFAENKGGTPGYWAPEIACGGTISPAADVWSLGATLHHLATGIAPVDGQPFLVTPRLADTPELLEVIRACLTVEPSARPAMSDVALLIKGGDWTSIRAQRQRNLLYGVGGAAFLALLLASRK